MKRIFSFSATALFSLVLLASSMVPVASAQYFGSNGYAANAYNSYNGYAAAQQRGAMAAKPSVYQNPYIQQQMAAQYPAAMNSYAQAYPTAATYRPVPVPYPYPNPLPGITGCRRVRCAPGGGLPLPNCIPGLYGCGSAVEPDPNPCYYGYPCNPNPCVLTMSYNCGPWYVK